ncbi:hypothetical protein DXC84_07485 [Ruminococcus sp. TF08-4]|nr:hypothetical protein DXC84_07485 [Ruminococcus sp. TF08-4]
MNSIKIEMGAVLALKNVIQLNDLMKEYINDNDKEPSWDGFIYLYKSDDMKAENIKYRIPVQVKGKNQENLLKKQRISYPVEYKHLRNYYKDGGAFYVVVAISDDRRKTTIFYNALTTVKLNALLKNSEKKKPDQTKNVVLERLKNDDDKLLFKVLSQFGFDREQQGSGEGEIIEKVINIDVINKVDSIRVTSYLTTNEEEILKMVSSGELCLYGYRSDVDMWFPFDLEQQKDMRLKKVLQIDKTLGIDRQVYYNNYLVEREYSKDPIIRVSENLTIDLLGGKLNFNMHGNIKSLKRDVDFLYAILNGNTFWMDNKQVSEYTDVKLPADLKANMEMITDFYNALEEIEFSCDKRTDEFNENNWKAVTKLINVYHRKIKLKEDNKSEWYIWWWDEKIIPILIVKDENDKTQIVNWIGKEGYAVFTERETGGQSRLPKGLLFKRDIWERLYDVDEEILLRDIEKSDYSERTLNDLYMFFVEILAAYDITRNEKYFDMAQLLSDKLLQVDENNEYGIINKLQLLKRKRELSEDEISVLEKLEESTNDSMVRSAVNILLENKHNAKKLVNQLSEEDQATFKQFPIYNLL